MADFSKPITTDQYETLLQEIRDMQTSLVKMLDGTTDTNIPDGAKRWNATNQYYEKYDFASLTWVKWYGMLGVGQTWQYVSTSRVAGTVYTNNTGKPIMLSLNIVADLGNISYEIGINGSSIINQVLMNLDTTSGEPQVNATVIVPSGATYTLNLWYSSAVGWWELR